MNPPENPYCSPGALDEASHPPPPSQSTQLLLAIALGLQAGGFLGILSGCLAPLRYIIGPTPRDAAFMEDISFDVRVQILSESMFVLIGCTILGALFGCAMDFGQKTILTASRIESGSLLSTWRVGRLSLRGILFAVTVSAPVLLLLCAAYTKADGYFWIHGLWGIAHFLLAGYFGERFAEAYRRARNFSAS